MRVHTKKLLERELLLIATIVAGASGLVTLVARPIGVFSYATAGVLFIVAMMCFGWYCFVGRIYETTEQKK